MSRTTIYAFKTDGSMVQAGEYSNSWGSGFFIWKSLQEKYLPEYNGQYILLPHISRKIWDLASDTTPASNSERGVLMTTFDFAVAYRKNFKELATALRAFKDAYWKGDVVCSLGAQADTLDSLADDESIVAVGWQQTSVSENLFWMHDSPEDEEGRPYDITKDSKHWNIFEDEAELIADQRGQ